MSTGVRCSVAVREAGLDPAGTANNVMGYVLLEVPLPWERKIEKMRAIRALADRAADLGLRPQLVHDISPAARAHRVVVVDRDEGPFVRYRRRVWTLPALRRRADRAHDIAALALDALDDRVAPDAETRPPDVLLCTHGARDVCCGSTGMKLATAFAAHRPDLVVWRTSHLGGHRFAPTALTLPDGNLWAYCDEALLSGVVDRSIDPSVAAPHLRGCSAAPPAAQLVERAALLAEGWSLLDARRATGVKRIAKEAGGGHDAWCDVTRADGSRIRYAGRVTVNRVVHVPPCGGTDPTDTARDHRLDDLTVTPLEVPPPPASSTAPPWRP